MLDLEHIQLSLAEIDIIKHTLGYDYGKVAFRNHFCTQPTSNDGVVCEGLVTKGLMENHGSNPNLVGGCCYYACTDDCKSLIKRICGFAR